MAVNDLASGALAGTKSTEILFAGEQDITTSAAPSLVASAAKYEVLALTATGLTTFVTGTHTANQAVVAMQPVTTIGQQVAITIAGGVFNHAVLTWPAALDTYAKRLNFAQGAAFKVGKLLQNGNPVWAA